MQKRSILSQIQDVDLFCSQWKVREKQSPHTTPPEQKARKVSFVTDLLQNSLFFPHNTRRPDVVNNSNPYKPL